jgi:hypothetical protein
MELNISKAQEAAKPKSYNMDGKPIKPKDKVR